MNHIKNLLLTGAEGRSIATDICFVHATAKLPVVIYAHGFNGFKDWGNADLLAAHFAKAGFVFVKFNFSHNGTTPQQPEEFTDLEAFGNNNYTRQLYDLQQVINWICDVQNPYYALSDTMNIALIGHSMGGGISILYAATDSRITKLVGWAAISECKTPWGNWPPEKMKDWQQTGVQYYHNGRTGQQMPLYWQLYKDYLDNSAQLDIQQAISKLAVPILLCHGTEDMAVPVEKAYQLSAWQAAARLFTVASDHVFGRKHPWPYDYLPEQMDMVVTETINFLQAQSTP